MIARRAVGLLLAIALGSAPAVAQPAPDQRAAIAAALADAASFLCRNCRNDIEAEGVNRAGRRSMLADADLARAEELAVAVPAVLARIRAARRALDSQDEAAALDAIRAGRRLLRR